MNNEIFKSVVIVEAFRLVVSTVLLLAIAATWKWWRGFKQRQMMRRLDADIAAMNQRDAVDRLFPAPRGDAEIVPPPPEIFGCRHCPSCHCWTGGTQGPCMLGAYCDPCKTKSHANKEGSAT